MRPRPRATKQRLEDVVGAIRAIHGHLGRGDLTDPLVFDAVRMRFVEIGEAVGALPDALLASEPSIPWPEVVAMRHKLAHHYYDAAVGVLAATVSDDLPALEAAVGRMLERVG